MRAKLKRLPDWVESVFDPYREDLPPRQEKRGFLWEVTGILCSWVSRILQNSMSLIGEEATIVLIASVVGACVAGTGVALIAGLAHWQLDLFKAFPIIFVAIACVCTLVVFVLRMRYRVEQA